ncbi:phage tail length tape measure family protein [Sphingomonas sp. 22R3R2A-7]|uniref:phage tail length tape measure family protein n=1 Tax=Sphingomonas sp. 22R3R2A-7 TaxID=3050230 RepID=UPI002FE02952
MASSSQFDIVARLQLRAEQFSSEGGRSFADLATKARTSAAGIRDSFGQSFAEVQKLAEQSLKLPRTATGSLDLSGEITSLRQAAAAADEKAAVARELNAAMLAASASSRTVTEAMRLEADAAMVAARAEEADAGAIRQRILALEAVQVELNKTASATGIHTRAANDNTKSAGQQQQSMLMLGQQIQDFAVQTANGGSVATAFSQQIGQVGFALTGMGGKLGVVGAFLGTFAGTATLVALTVLPPLIAKLLDSNDALEDAVTKLKKTAAEAEITAKAQDMVARSADGVAMAIREQTKALDEGDKALRTRAEQANIDAKMELAREIAVRRSTLALIEQTKAMAEGENLRSLGPGGVPAVVATQYEAKMAKLKKDAADQQAKIDQAEQNVQRTRIDLAAEAAKRSVDPMERIKKLYDDQAAAAQRAATAEAARGKNVDASLTRELAAIEKKRQAKMQEERDRQSASSRKPARDAELASPTTISKLLRDTLGARITSTTGGKHVAGSDHYRGAALDFVPKGGMGSMTKDDVRAIFEKAGVSIRRNAGGVEQLFGPGDKGHSDHFHVAWEKGKLAVDNYRASVRDTAKAEREAAQEQKKLDTALEQILGKFDPAADAARRYRDELGEIDKLAGAGKITPDQQVVYIRNAKRDFTASQTTAAHDNFRLIMGPVEVDGAIAAWQAGIDATGDQMRDHAEAAGIAFSDQVRDGIAGVADLLGIRISGPARTMLQPGGIEAQAGSSARSLIDGLRNSPLKISTESLDRLEKGIGSVLTGASYGQLGGSLFASITGGKQNQLGSAVGGALGKVAGDALGKTVASTIGGTLGKTLGGAAGPLGAIAGGIVGSVIGGLFKKSTSGSSTLTFGSDGLAAGTAKGNGTAEKAAASASANSVAGSLNRIAEALGGTVTGAGSVSLGYRPGHKAGAYRVDPTGQGNVKGGSVMAFATEEEAVRAAIADALSDGVIGGISAASKRILAAGGDLEKALSKALMIEAVPKDLKAMLDPVGAAIDELNAKFLKTVDALKEGGASAEQMMQAQQLYDLQLAQVKNSTAAASASLKDFVASLKMGSNSPYSLRDQEQTAKAALAPYLAQIAGGKTIDQSKYQAAAQTYLDIERQLYGSTKAYFDALDAVQAATNKAISTIDNATPIGTSVESPFAKATAASAAATATGVQTTNELLDQMSQQAALTNDLLARLTLAAGNDSSFIGSGRSFVAAG